MSNPKIIAMVADSPSSDFLGAGIIKELKILAPNIIFLGIGGPKMQALGFISIYPIEKLSVMGFNNFFSNLARLKNTQRKVISLFSHIKPNAFIGIDAYSLNIKIHQALKKENIPTIQYACPKVWAWRTKRIIKIKKAMDLVITLFPFEKDFLEKHNINSICVGHFLANEIPLKPINTTIARKKMKIDPKETIVAILPGSRQSDLKFMVPLFLKTIKKIKKTAPHFKYFVPLPSEKLKKYFIQLMKKEKFEFNIEFSINNSQEIIKIADLVLVKSGTATLETMLLKKPMVVAYKTGIITSLIFSWLVKIPYVSLPNLLANKEIVKEFLLKKANPDIISKTIIELINNPNQEVAFYTLHRKLNQFTHKNLAEKLLELI